MVCFSVSTLTLCATICLENLGLRVSDYLFSLLDNNCIIEYSVHTYTKHLYIIIQNMLWTKTHVDVFFVDKNKWFLADKNKLHM